MTAAPLRTASPRWLRHPTAMVTRRRSELTVSTVASAVRVSPKRTGAVKSKCRVRITAAHTPCPCSGEPMTVDTMPIAMPPWAMRVPKRVRLASSSLK